MESPLGSKVVVWSVISGGVCLFLVGLVLSLLILVQDEAFKNLMTTVFQNFNIRKKKRKNKSKLNKVKLKESTPTPLEWDDNTSWESIFTVNPPPTTPPTVLTTSDHTFNNKLCQRSATPTIITHIIFTYLLFRCHKFDAKAFCR